jgi:hypothetical protein
MRACVLLGSGGRSRVAEAGLAGRDDQLDAGVEVQRGRVEHQVTQARILAVDTVGAPDVADPCPVLDLLAPLCGPAVDALQGHPLLHVNGLAGSAQMDVHGQGTERRTTMPPRPSATPPVRLASARNSSMYARSRRSGRSR